MPSFKFAITLITAGLFCFIHPLAADEFNDQFFNNVQKFYKDEGMDIVNKKAYIEAPKVKGNVAAKQKTSLAKKKSKVKKRVTLLKDLKKKLYKISSQTDTYTSIEAKKDLTITLYGVKMTISKGNTLDFYRKSGQLMNVWGYSSSSPVMIPRYKKKGKYSGWTQVSYWIGLHPDGTLEFACSLGKNQTFKVGKYKIPFSTYSDGMTKIWFYPKGQVKELHIKKPVTLKAYGTKMTFGHQPYCGGDLAFSYKGFLKKGVLHKPAKVNGISFPKKTHLNWRGRKLHSAGIYPGKFKVQGWVVGGIKKSFSYAYFNKNGKLSTIKKLGQNRTYKGKTYKKGQNLVFKDNGVDVSYTY